jgi:hypothetical protein
LYDNSIIKNKYGIELSKNLLCRYYDDLIGNFYKILNIYEGRDFQTKKIIYSSEIAYVQYKKYVGNFIHEICGGYYLFDENTYFLKLLTSLESMLSIKETEHDNLKSLVFGCINTLNKLKGEVLNGV